MNDLQISGLLDIVIAQEKDLLELKASVYALAKIAREALGDQVAPQFERYAQELRTEATNRGHDSRIQLLESMSLQLKQSDQPIH